MKRYTDLQLKATLDPERRSFYIAILEKDHHTDEILDLQGGGLRATHKLTYEELCSQVDDAAENFKVFLRRKVK